MTLELREPDVGALLVADLEVESRIVRVRVPHEVRLVAGVSGRRGAAYTGVDGRDELAIVAKRDARPLGEVPEVAVRGLRDVVVILRQEAAIRALVVIRAPT